MRARTFVVSLALAAAACTPSAAVPAAAPAPTTTAPATTTTVLAPTTTTTTVPPSTTTTTTTPTYSVSGTVSSPDGVPLPATSVTIADVTATTDDLGAFSLEGVPAGVVTVTRPAWIATEVAWDGAPTLDITLAPFVARALRVSAYVAMEPQSFANLLDLAERTAINALVFDTKDERGVVHYATGVTEAAELGAIQENYDIEALLAEAQARGFYTITRVVSFEDPIRAKGRPEAKLAGSWVDPVNPDNWEYPLALAVEACEMGFDEIQFDYVRFPAGITAQAAQSKRPLDAAARTEAITAYLTEARKRLHPLGCAVAADIFSIVLSSPTDEGIGQMPETISAAVDVMSPMIYPSHYSNGWLGFADPNDHPGPVVADALDDGMPRMDGDTIMRPWLQSFWYSGSQVRAEIDEAEERNVGWMLWNAGGNFIESSLPLDEEVAPADGADDAAEEAGADDEYSEG